MSHIETTVLEEFLSTPLDSSGTLFERFAALPGAIVGKGENPLEQYVCVPGSRKDRIVLVAHTDTVWDAAYGNPRQTTVYLEDGVYKGTNPECGIGADDRAGCAMLWQLRNSGHTLLLVNGEEKGKIGARYLKKSNPKLFRLLNRHRFMIEFDWQGDSSALYNQVDYTNRFQRYITKTLGFPLPPRVVVVIYRSFVTGSAVSTSAWGITGSTVREKLWWSVSGNIRWQK